ncbi:hypothetical protein U6A24_04465 [Aquimarina gracilis]|uniref:YtxH-like protein n=1 Tax=Aquimarina gracilis TaxID=874422 RepID=A0ABU5ZRK6_9FLAO|nr:hypothetical protein [Aquimarina gracilis]MEB3344699.1 hypothetical protein [Aquimarina gracilis]
MKRFKKLLRRIALILLIIMASLIPAPIFIQKKEGKFNDDNIIELVEQTEEKTEVATKKLDQELKS